MSRENPYKNDPGYVRAKRCLDSGFVVVYDKDYGGDWISVDNRWIVVKYSNEKNQQGIMDFKIRAAALIMMEATAIGTESTWYDKFDGWRC